MVKRMVFAVGSDGLDERASDEKRKLILDAALREFAENGYANASTNRIINEAGVSKGLLFYYFGSKRDLYLAVLDACVEHFLSHFERELRWMPDDVISRIIEIQKVKLKMLAEQPLMQRLVSSAFLDPPHELQGEMMNRQARLYSEYMPYFTQGLDWSRFRDGVDHGRAVELVMIVVNAIGDKYVKAFRETGYQDISVFDGFIDELKAYLELVKHGIYRDVEPCPSGGPEK